MRSKKYFSTILLLPLILFVSHLSAQRMNCQVAVDMPRLQPQDQQELADLASKLTDYLNNTRWSDSNQDIVLNCNISIIVQTVNQRGSDKVYLAQFLIGSPSGENYYDQSWEFTYIPGQSFEFFRTSFDPLLDLIDFYTYMVIGGEMDTYELLSGSPYYNKCQDIANRGQSSNFATGWKNRLDEAILITDGDHVPLREAKFYYYEGLYFVERNPNPEYARQFGEAVIDRLKRVHNKRPNSRALKRFFDAHFQELCKLFIYDNDRSNINILIEINPIHSETYRDCVTGGVQP
jgi:hypothetical protein